MLLKRKQKTCESTRKIRRKATYLNRNRTTVIVSIPKKRLEIARCASPWLNEIGSNSSKLMKTIIPATKAKTVLSTKGVMN